MFLAFFSLIVFSLWQVVHSEYVGKFLSKNVTKYVSKLFNTKINFKKVDLILFPPGVNLKDVHVNYKSDKSSFELLSKELIVLFDIFSPSNRKIVLEKVQFKDAYIKIDIEDKKENKKENSLNYKIDYKIRDLFKSSKVIVKSLFLEKTKLKLNNRDFWFEHSKLLVSKHRVKASGDMFLKSPYFDSLKYKIELTDNKLVIDKLKLKKHVNTVSFKGEIVNPLNSNQLEMNLDSNLEASLSSLQSYFDFSRYGTVSKGSLSSSAIIKGSLKEYSVVLSSKFKNIVSNFGDFDAGKFQVTLDQNTAKLDYLKLDKNDGYLKLAKEVEIINFITNKYLHEVYELEASNFSLYNSLKVLRKSLYPLRGFASGKLSVEFDKSDFVINTEPDFKLEKVLVNIDGTQIINVKAANLSPSVFAFKDNIFYMRSEMKLKNSLLNIEGEANQKSLYFSLQNSKVDLKDFGKIAGFDFIGEGKLDLIVEGPYSNAHILVNTKLSKSSFEKYYLGDLKANLKLDFKKNTLFFNDVEGKVGSTNYTIDGLVNYNNLDINLIVDLPHTSFNDLRIMHYPLLGELSVLPLSVSGLFNASYKVFNKATLEKVKVDGSIKADNVIFWGESFSKINFNFELDDLVLDFKKIFIKKNRASIVGDYTYDFNIDSYKTSLKSRRLKLTDFNNYKKLPGLLKSDINFDFNLNYLKRDKASLSVELRNSSVGKSRIEDSNLLIKQNMDVLHFKSNLFGSYIKLESDLNLENKKTEIKIDYDIKNLTKFFISILGIHARSDISTGRLNGDLRAKFKFDNFDSMDLSFNVNDLLIQRKNIFITNASKLSGEIKKGKIKKWDFEIKGNNASLKSKASGDISKKYNIDLWVDYDANLIELLSPKIIKSTGYIKNHFKFYKEKKKNNLKVVSSSSNLSMYIDNFPTIIRKANYSLVLFNDKLNINNTKIDLTQGTLELSGHINLGIPFPKVNVAYVLKKAEFEPFIKTYLSLTGNGSIVGSKFPYVISGDVNIEKANIFTELNDFGFKSSDFERNTFFPKNTIDTTSKYVNLNISVNTLSNILMSNSLFEVSMYGSSLLRGNMFNPKMSGRYSFATNTGKVTFKNNDFIFSKGDIIFSDSSKFSNPEIDLSASSKINQYLIKMHVFGTINDYQVELTSNPPLSKSDILSMIAFGYTGELAKNISDLDKKSLSSLGLGTILFDRFKISKALKKSFGLQVNLGTELQEQSVNVLNKDSDSQVGQIRTATKIELKKKLFKDANLSFSSNVGGSIGQKQSANLNVKINNEVSIEIVHERKTNIEGDDQIQNESTGFDLKYRWSN